MVISIFSNYQQQQISVYAQQVVKILRRSDEGKSIKMSFKNVRYSAQKTVSNHLKVHCFRFSAENLYVEQTCCDHEGFSEHGDMNKHFFLLRFLGTRTRMYDLIS